MDKIQNRYVIKIHFDVKDNPMFQNIFRRISVSFSSTEELNEIINDYEIIVNYLKNDDFSKNLDRRYIKIFDKIFNLGNEYECYKKYSFVFPCIKIFIRYV
uniref:Uncharacterized protein n=1 Tax=viral metagenome TaxID=1070528 RepID=A0A6C0AEH0_9ZZZZ